MLNEILLARDNGDFTYENKFTQEGSSLAKQRILNLSDEAVSTTDIPKSNINNNELEINKINTKLNITISAFIEQYKDTKINDGDWTT